MREDQALLRAVCDSPEDDAPRLVYADWLDEHGDPDRAEFIRLQCERARLAEDDPRQDGLARRERRLLRGNRKAWEAERPAFAGAVEFVRGFLVPRLHEPAVRFLQRRPEEFGDFPLWHFTLTGLANLAGKLQFVAELAACPHLLRARALNLANNAIGTEGAQRLADSPHLGHLTTLGLCRNWVRADGVRALVESAPCPRVTDLDLGCNWINNEGAAALASSPLLANVTDLDLRMCWLGDTAAEALARSPYTGRLRTLHLHDNSIRDAGAEALAAAPWVRGLKTLSLPGGVGNAGAFALARSPYLEGIVKLDLSACHQIGAQAARALRERFDWRVLLHWRCR